MFRKAQLYFHTLRYLKLKQLWGRVSFRLLRPKLDLRPAPAVRQSSRAWQIPAARLTSMMSPTRFRFLNFEHDIRAPADWNSPELPKLWLYNLHYFDDLNADGAVSRAGWHRNLIARWITENPPGIGAGWEPYPLSLRIVNWLKWVLAGNALGEDMHQSLAVQARFLKGRIERHLLGNHLFANAKAFIFLGCFFEGDEAEAWLRCGLDILEHEVPEQVLADGGHFERSTMYHALVLEDMLDLVNVTRCFANRLSLAQQRQVASWPQRASELHAWLLTMCHPDGEISLFNDAAFDISPNVVELDSYVRRVLVGVASKVPSPLVQLRESGYLRLASGPAVALLDVAPVGPDYLPGHAHADTLSFELSVGTQRVLVNSGTSCYGSSPERLRQRGTAAHNTVVVNGEDSSEVWGGFRVARRAYPLGLNIQQSADGTATEVRCAHNGYVRLTGKPIHHRTWRLDAHGLTVTDRVEGPHQSAEARFHFHPLVQVQMGSNQTEGTATLPDGRVLTWRQDKCQVRLEASTWHPRFGHFESNMCLVVKLLDGHSNVHFSWNPY